MVDTREGLKHNVETDLKKRIQIARKFLNELQESLRLVEEESFKAKYEVTKAAESVQQTVNRRSLELSRQIDAVCNEQITSLQEEIQSTCVTIGSLQSMLSNLDSFDKNQLVALHLPNVPLRQKSVPSCMSLKIDDMALTNEINRWGNVAVKDEFYLVPSHPPCSSSVTSFLCPPKLPSLTKDKLKGMPNMYTDNIEMEKWISGGKSIFEDDIDSEFEMVYEPPRRKNSSSSDSSSASDESASIVCLENCNNNELSKWLKPKAATKTSDTLFDVKKIEEQCNAAYFHNGNDKNKAKTVDFPCLKTDPKTWVPVKTNRLRCFENVPSKVNIPPEHTLPAPFWIKKRF